MNNKTRGYAWQKLSQALASLISDGQLKQRLLEARQPLRLLENAKSEVPEEGRDLLISIVGRLGTLEACDIPEMEKIGEDMLELFAICLESRVMPLD